MHKEQKLTLSTLGQFVYQKLWRLKNWVAQQVTSPSHCFYKYYSKYDKDWSKVSRPIKYEMNFISYNKTSTSNNQLTWSSVEIVALYHSGDYLSDQQLK
jgi:hypothetical protein